MLGTPRVKLWGIPVGRCAWQGPLIPASPTFSPRGRRASGPISRTSTMSFPRRRESRAEGAMGGALDPRFGGDDGEGVSDTLGE